MTVKDLKTNQKCDFDTIVQVLDDCNSKEFFLQHFSASLVIEM